MTQRLYYTDSYATTFSSRVLAVDPTSEGRHRVVLERTLFYPTSGGQMHDTGTLAGARVVDVLDEDERIVHVVEGDVLAVGQEVEGVVDGERRRQHRQQHTGQHVLSRVVEDRLGLETVSSRLGESGNTLDLATDPLDRRALDEIEDATNRLLWEGHAVHVHLLDPDRDAERLESWGLRRKREGDGPVRVIEVEGVDLCPCGGTHVRHTAEIGLVAITGTERIKGGSRIHFLCGERALRWRRQRHHWLDDVARRLTTGHDQVDETVERLVEEKKESHKRLMGVAAQLVAFRAHAWVQQAPRRGDGIRVVIRHLDEDEALADAAALRAVIRHERTVGAVLRVDGEKGKLAVARHPDLDLDCRAVLDAALAAAGGRGGGQPDHARGGFPAAQSDAVEKALRTALESGRD